MKKKARFVYAAALALLVSSTAQSQTLSTTAADNGSGGIFMTFTPLVTSLRLTSFETYFGSVNTPVSVEMWVRDGSYGDYMNSHTGWTLAETISGVTTNPLSLSTLTLSNPLDLLFGTSTSVYLHSLTDGAGIRYQGTGNTVVANTWTNGELEMFSNDAQIGEVPFGGTQFMPRTFAGNVNYERLASVPEPNTAVLLLSGAFGMVATVARRKRQQ